MKRSQTKDMIWHIGKTLLCAIQFWILAYPIRSESVESLQAFEGEVSALATFAHLAYPAIIAALFFILWGYYDNIDDRSFNRVRQASEPPKFLRTPAYLLGIVLTTLAVTPILTSAFRPFFYYIGLGAGAGVASVFTALVITAGGSVLRVSRLNNVWVIQSKMPVAKPPSIPGRIFYAVVFFVALLLISNAVVIGVFLLGMILLSLFVIPALIVAGLILLWCFVILPALNIPARRKFMQRLQRLRDQGKISAEIHGHPYLSLFIGLIPFGLTITDVPHPDTKVQIETTYRVTFANCKRRREMVILCEHQIYQFVYSLKFSHVTRFSRMGANKAGVRTVAIPGMSWFTNHSFDFPEGEGKRILLIDPTPTVLAIRGERGGELFELDNASEIYGYTVYGKNSFLNLLERM